VSRLEDAHRLHEHQHQHHDKRRNNKKAAQMLFSCWVILKGLSPVKACSGLEDTSLDHALSSRSQIEIATVLSLVIFYTDASFLFVSIIERQRGYLRAILHEVFAHAPGRRRFCRTEQLGLAQPFFDLGRIGWALAASRQTSNQD
jgi:hypothetical protein